MKIKYKDINFKSKSLELINLINKVINEYKDMGYELTLRQAYYQLVARGYIPNNEHSYKNIGALINDGRLAGLIDWYSIVDRTRFIRKNSHWEKPEDIILSAKYSYLLDKWDGQPTEEISMFAIKSPLGIAIKHELISRGVNVENYLSMIDVPEKL